MSPKSYFQGTHRVRTPAETLALMRPRMREMGITRLANVTGLDIIGIPVVMACRPNARTLAVSQGKGMTLEAANASALMETVESYYAENIIAPLKLASYDELTRDHDVLDVSKLPIEFHSRFHPNLRLLWIEGRQWNGNQTRWTPYQLVHSSYTTD